MALSLDRAGTCTSSVEVCRRHPCFCKAAKVLPRARALTCAPPAAANRVPKKPPMAPAPTMHTLFIFLSPIDSNIALAVNLAYFSYMFHPTKYAGPSPFGKHDTSHQLI
jgi:hypothetical protein